MFPRLGVLRNFKFWALLCKQIHEGENDISRYGKTNFKVGDKNGNKLNNSARKILRLVTYKVMDNSSYIRIYFLTDISKYTKMYFTQASQKRFS